MLRAMCWGFVLLLPLVSFPDSITVGGDTYRDVYIRSDANNYYIHFPEEGRMERVSKKRTDVRNVQIGHDEAERTALLEAYKAAKDKPNTPEPAARPNREDADATPLSLEAYKEREQRRAAALFDAQFAFWKSLSAEQRSVIEQNLAGLAEDMHQSYSQTLGTLEGKIGALEGERKEHSNRLRELETQRNVVAGLSRIGDQSEVYRNRGRDLQANSQSELGQRLGQVYSDVARAEEERIANQRARIQQEYGRQASPHMNAIGSIDSSIAKQKRQGIAVESNAREQTRRVGGYLNLAAHLNAALEQDYTPQVRSTVVREEQGTTSKKTASFEIDAPFWRLECTRADLSHMGEFAVTVCDAETGLPFTRIPGADLLQMRIQMLDGPGEFYLEITTDDSNLPYTIIVSAFPETERG